MRFKGVYKHKLIIKDSRDRIADRLTGKNMIF